MGHNQEAFEPELQILGKQTRMGRQFRYNPRSLERLGEMGHSRDDWAG